MPKTKFCSKCKLYYPSTSYDKCPECKNKLIIKTAGTEKKYKHEKREKRLTNIVSLKNFIILSILSFGIYELVWMYRNWKYFKEKEKTDISPFWRAFFGIWFVYSLFKKILTYSKKEKYKESYSAGWRAFFWIILGFMAYFENNILFLICFLTFLPIIDPLDAMNFYYSKIEKNCKPRVLKWWHIILIILCIIVWIDIFVGMFIP